MTEVQEMQTGGVAMPYTSAVVRDDSMMDPYLQQLLYGLSGVGGFIPGAMRAAERTFFDAEGRPIVIGQQIAGLSPDQLIAQNLARSQVGSLNPYLQTAEGAFRRGLGSLRRGQAQQSALTGLGVSELQRAADEEERQRTLGLERSLGGVDEATELLRGTTGAFDPSDVSRFYDPYEDQVVQQVIQDATERLTKQDIAARDRDIAQGGLSAFGDRARLTSAERAKAMGEGLAKALGSLRSGGFQRAQSAAMGEFARQQAAQRAASSGLAGLGQQAQRSRELAGAGALSTASQLAQGYGNLGAVQGNIGQTQLAAQGAFGSQIQGLGQQARGAAQQDISALQASGLQSQQQLQTQLDAERARLLQAQQAPLAQYQALQPFVTQGIQSGGRGSQVRTQFTPPPNPLTAGIGTALSTFGALGQFANQGMNRPAGQNQYTQPQTQAAPVQTSQPINYNFPSTQLQPFGSYIDTSQYAIGGANPQQFDFDLSQYTIGGRNNPFNEQNPFDTSQYTIGGGGFLQ